jgi:SAM-dependent methyltransferase
MFGTRQPPSRLGEPATAEDVRALYRIVLGREVESKAAVASHLRDAPSLETVLHNFLNSEEAARRSITRTGDLFFFGDWDDSGVQVEGEPEKIDRLLAMVREAWTRLGQTEPHYSVLTGPQFAPDRMTPEREAEFYASGAREIDVLERICQRNGLSFRAGSVLDFGCGLARLGEHLSARFDRYTGVDISPAHLRMATDRLRHLGRGNAELMLLDDFLAAPERRWDRIVTYLVIQHNPPPVMRWLLLQLLQRLAPGGVALIQFPVQQFGYRFDLDAYLAAGGNRGMEMHALPLRHVFAAVAEAGCQVREVFPDGKTGPLGLSCSFLFVRPDASQSGGDLT